MELNENLKKYDIKFYENPDGTIHYENAFLDGDAKTLKDAFTHFSKKDLDWELPYFYEDIFDVRVGAYEPALRDKKSKGRKYLGKINLQLDIQPSWGTGEHSVTYLSKNRDKIKDHEKWINKMKRDEAIEKFINKLKDGLKNAFSEVKRKLSGRYQYEMFYPEKTRNDLICSHCGNIIPKGSYYEEYQRKNYHLECLWDSLFNEKSDHTQETAKDFFYSLKKYLRLWPFHGLDTKDDYKFDLELVQSNDRKFKDLV